MREQLSKTKMNRDRRQEGEFLMGSKYGFVQFLLLLLQRLVTLRERVLDGGVQEASKVSTRAPFRSTRIIIQEIQTISTILLCVPHDDSESDFVARKNRYF